MDASLNSLVVEAWRLHHRDPLQLLPQGERIVAAADAAGDALALAWGWLHQAWGQRFRGAREASEDALQKAEAGFAQLEHGHGLASCRDVRVMGLSTEGRFADAAALLALNDARPESGRSAWERISTLQRLSLLHTLQGDRDSALKVKYLFLAAARETGEAAAVAQAMAAIGGEHADLFDFEEAERLCRCAMTLADEGGALHAWCMAALNGMNAVVAQGRGAEVVSWVERLLTLEPSQNRHAREHRLIVYADALAQDGQFDRAQAMLDDSKASRGTRAGHTLSWVVAQCEVWSGQARWQAVREAAETWLQDPQYGNGPGLVPTEELRLLRRAAQACEATGELVGALAWERRAFELHEELVGRSARARRLALEVEHQLESERHQRSQAEAERQRLDGLNRALEEANAAKTRFLAAASHDLRQPVQALALNMAALEHESATPAQTQLVQRMSASLKALTQMFDVLLDISRLDAGIVPVALEPLALAPLLERLSSELGAAAHARGLRLRLHLPPAAATAYTTSDAVLLERCLRNLLDNALKYTPSGGILLALRPRREAWQVQVTDSGLGMTPEVLAQACDEFFQADNPERDRNRGLGLGLAIVQRVLLLLGHTLELHSRHGRGTTARVQLARTPPPAARLQMPVSSDEGAPTIAGWVVVVDDDLAVREAMATLLERWGHRVLHAAEPEALLRAWSAAGRPRVQALVTDLRLRGTLDGLQVVQALRASWGEGLPALVITGDVAPDRLQRLRDSGLPWLAKPVMPLRLRGWLAARA